MHNDGLPKRTTETVKAASCLRTVREKKGMCEPSASYQDLGLSINHQRKSRRKENEGTYHHTVAFPKRFGDDHAQGIATHLPPCLARTVLALLLMLLLGRVCPSRGSERGIHASSPSVRGNEMKPANHLKKKKKRRP